ncbi:MAG: hypothetical protein ACRD0X_04165, partial [Thermoanaerobaculia bacterium]
MTAGLAWRRRWLGRLSRLRRWEFWPAWAVYPPIVLYVLALGLRHRGLTVFTAANPGIPAGGFIGESKAAILSRLGSVPGWRIPPWRLLPAASPVAERLKSVRDFCAVHDLDYPLVLKPDAGQRGSGVAIVEDDAGVESYLRRTGCDTLLQDYAPGLEFGLFYVRFPDEPRGRLVAITEKRLPEIVGDGRRTIAELIVADERAVCRADLYLARQGAERERVPAAGERVALAQLGTHCRGAVFSDGSALATPALAAAVEAMSRTFEGFHFGRYDVRAPSAAALAAGGPLALIELNGVTSEPTHAYDTRYGLLAAWRTLAWQWRTAFA